VKIQVLISLALSIICLTSCNEADLADCTCQTIRIFGYPNCGILLAFPLSAKDVKKWEPVEYSDSKVIERLYSELLELNEANHQLPVDNRFLLELNCSNGRIIEVESNCGHVSYGKKHFIPTESFIDYVKTIAKNQFTNDIQKDKTETKVDSSNYCSSKILKETSSQLVDLDVWEIRRFLSTFHLDCSQNAKFSQWSNELLFSIALINSELLINEMTKLNEDICKIVIEEFESPIQDFDLNKVIESINMVNSNTKMKTEVLQALKKAVSKNNSN